MTITTDVTVHTVRCAWLSSETRSRNPTNQTIWKQKYKKYICVNLSVNVRMYLCKLFFALAKVAAK